MIENVLYYLSTMLIVDFIIVIACVISYFWGNRTGYRWRKMLWLVLSVRLLIPVHLLMGVFFEETPAYMMQFNMSAFVEEGTPADKNEGVLEGPLMRETSQEAKRATGTEADAEDRIETDTQTELKTGMEVAGATGEKLESERQENGTLGFVNGLTQNSALNSEVKITEKSDITTGQEPKESNRFNFVSLWSNKTVGIILLLLWLISAERLLVYRTKQFGRIAASIQESSRSCGNPYMQNRIKELCVEYSMKYVPEIMVCRRVISPMLFGYRKPILLLPRENYSDMEANMILQHELQHYRSGDLWYKLLLMVVCDLHWFNPCLILMKQKAYEDVEYVCDDRVMCHLNAQERKVYGNIILQGMAGGLKLDIAYGTTFSMGKTAAKTRIQNMFSKKNKKGYFALGALFLCVVFGTCLWNITGDNVSMKTDGITDGIESGIEDNVIEDSTVETDESAKLLVYLVESMEVFNMPDEFAIEDYYCTNHVTVGNRYFIDENNVLWGYGRNEFGQLGIGKVDNTDTFYSNPQKIAENVITVDSSCNGFFAIYLTADGELYGMGSNKIGLLGQPFEERISDNDYVKVPEPVLLMEDVAYASAGMHSIVALKKDGSVWWWGEYKSTYATKDTYYLKYWQIEEEENNPAKMMYIQPKKVLDNCIYASAGDWNGAAITAEGELYTWGLNIFGECGVEVTEDDYVRKPAKVLDDVKMAWFEEAKNGSLEQDVQDFDNRKFKYDFTLFAQLKNGTILAAGKDLGEKEKTIELTGDILTPSTEKYSDTFVPIALEEYSEAACRAKLNKLEWGMTVSEAEQVLEQEGLYYLELLSSVEGTENELAVSELYVEDEKYILDFGKEKRLNEIRLLIGGNRNGSFFMGMTLKEVQSLLDCGLFYEQSNESTENVYKSSVYWTEEPIEGSYIGFIFSGDAEKTLSTVLERGSLDTILTNAPRISVLDIPSEEEVLSMRALVTEGMSEEEIERLTENVRIFNQELEWEYLYRDLFGRLEDKESLSWNYFDKEGDIQIGWASPYSAQEMVQICEEEGMTTNEFYQKYGEPVMEYNRYGADNFIDLFADMQKSVQNEKLSADLQYIMDETRLAADTHDVDHVNNLYKILHDMDYFLLRYGPTDDAHYIGDISMKYYDSLSVYREESEFEMLLQSKGIAVTGKNDEKVTVRMIDGFVKDIDPKYSWVIDKYVKLVEGNPGGMELELIDLLELRFYSLPDADKERFLADAENQKVTVQMDTSGALLVSYNPNL